MDRGGFCWSPNLPGTWKYIKQRLWFVIPNQIHTSIWFGIQGFLVGFVFRPFGWIRIQSGWIQIQMHIPDALDSHVTNIKLMSNVLFHNITGYASTDFPLSNYTNYWEKQSCKFYICLLISWLHIDWRAIKLYINPYKTLQRAVIRLLKCHDNWLLK